jgi:hypothetical protein
MKAIVERFPRRLPVRPRPYVGEASAGYLGRVIFDNGHRNPQEVFSRFSSISGSTEHRIRWALKLPKHYLKCLTGPFPTYSDLVTKLPQGLLSSDFNHVHLRWCPACLEEAPYIRGAWMLKLSCVCSNHSLMLCDQCPACRTKQDIRRALTICQSCGFELSRSQSQSAAPAICSLQRRILDGMENVEATRTASAIRFVKVLAQLSLGLPMRRSGQIAGMHKLTQSLQLLTAAADLLSDWPSKFRSLLTTRYLSGPTSGSLSRTYGSLYRVIYADAADQHLQLLRDAFDEHVRETWTGQLCRRNKRLSAQTVQHHSQKSLREISWQTRSPKSKVKQLAQAGLIQASSFHHQTGRITWSLAREASTQVRAFAADSVSLKEAREILGLGKKRVRELIDDGVIRVWIRPDVFRASAWSISKADIHSLSSLSVANGFPGAHLVDKNDLVSLSEVFRTWRLRQGEFAAVVQAIQATTFECYVTPESVKGIRSWRLKRSNLQCWLQEFRRQTSEKLSIDAAAKELGVKQQVAYELVRKGWLACTASKDKAERGVRVSREAMHAFQQEFVSLKELSRLRGIGVRKLLSILPSQPVCGPTVDGGRQYFYRKLDLNSTSFSYGVAFSLIKIGAGST